MANVRGKFTVSVNGTQVTGSAVTDQSTPENQRFARATPAGTLAMQVDNPAALDYFKGRQGKAVYVDFSDAE